LLVIIHRLSQCRLLALANSLVRFSVRPLGG
jgi:hypothetical protein